MGKRNVMWVIIFSVVIIVCLACILIFTKNETALSADIYVGDVLEKHIDDISDSELHTYRVETDSGFNEICWQKGEIWVSKADCANQTCVNFGRLKSTGVSVICAPHKVVITLSKGGKEQ